MLKQVQKTEFENIPKLVVIVAPTNNELSATLESERISIISNIATRVTSRLLGKKSTTLLFK